MPLVYDKAKDAHICSIHGEVDSDSVGWLPCWYGCEDGYIDDYEDDPINCDEGDTSPCPECRGNGGWNVCGECNKGNPDIEW